MVSEDGTPLPIGTADIVIANNALYQFPSKMEGVEQLSQHAWWNVLQNYTKEHGYTTQLKYSRLFGGLAIIQYGQRPLRYLPLSYAEDFQIGKMERYKTSFI